MPSPAAKPGTLSRNNQLVLDKLSDAAIPMSAYELLDELREDGLRAPPQIYRALKWLGEQGLVHKLSSANTYVACAHASCCGGEKCADGQSVFLMCDECGAVKETEAKALESDVQKLANGLGFTPTSASLEVHGLCESCQTAR